MSTAAFTCACETRPALHARTLVASIAVICPGPTSIGWGATMNEVAYVSEQASRRVNLRDLADLPCDMVAVFDALDDLNPWQFKTWFRLRVHLYRYGELPTGMKALARIACIGAAAFERMAAAIARQFDRAATGAGPIITWCARAAAASSYVRPKRQQSTRISGPSGLLPAARAVADPAAQAADAGG